ALRREPGHDHAAAHPARARGAGARGVCHRVPPRRAGGRGVRRSRVHPRRSGQARCAPFRRVAAVCRRRCGVLSRPGREKGVSFVSNMAQPPVIATDYLHSVIRMVRRAARYWWVALATIVLGAALTLAVAKTMTNQYRSEAVLYYQEGMQ